jgi:hypothetical protein
MSSPVPDDPDKKLLYAVPWVSDPQREDETRRLQEQVVEAAQRLERESSGLPFEAPVEPPRLQNVEPPRPQNSVGFRLAASPPSQDKYGIDDFGRIWAPLRPELMPPPPRETGVIGLGLVAGLLGAVGAAAAIALVVTNVVRLPVRFPTLSAAISSAEVAQKSKSVSSIVLADLSQIQGAQANVQPAEPPPATARAPMLAPAHVASLPVDPPSVAAPSVTAPSASLQVGPNRPDTQSLPPVASTPPPAAAPEPRATVTLAPDEIASMLKRGRELIAAGDIPSGRLLLTHVAEAGDAEAAFLLAGTYDATVLAKLRVVGVQPDAAKAQAWYARAAEEGSIEAKQHLRQSALR